MTEIISTIKKILLQNGVSVDSSITEIDYTDFATRSANLFQAIKKNAASLNTKYDLTIVQVLSCHISLKKKVLFSFFLLRNHEMNCQLYSHS